MTAKLWKRASQYRQAFKHDDCYRTSNQVDRLMNRMTRLMYSGRGLHGNHTASERRLRGWALMAVGATKPLKQFIEHTLSNQVLYDLTDAHLAAILQLESLLSSQQKPQSTIVQWLRACERELSQRVAETRRPPADYRRENKLTCRCSDCSRVGKFLEAPDGKELRVPMAKERRQHMHQAIDSTRCDLSHFTQRSGRPYTLVFTKTTASYDAACKVFERDKEN